MSEATDEQSLDPTDWTEVRAVARAATDRMIDYLANLRKGPVWQPMPDHVREGFKQPLPRTGSGEAGAYNEFLRLVLPYAAGNAHPGFSGWVHGGGTTAGMIAELLAAGIDANLGGRDHAPIEVEKQIVAWAAELFGLPTTATGLMVSGSSIANLAAVIAARTSCLGRSVGERGIANNRLIAYASTETHACLARAMDFAGLGASSLRLIRSDENHRVDPAAMESSIQRDRELGLRPFLVVGTAGTVDTGATDNLAALAEIAKHHGLWFHVDGAFGALAALSDRLRPALRGIEKADSVALDFHKWANVP